MKLSKRLGKIAEYVPQGSIVADIGTDHGYIPIYLIENLICEKVIAADVSKPSLDKTINYVKDIGYEDRINTRLGDGLAVLKPNEVDTIIIAGMGGVLMTQILNRSPEIIETTNNFIFQAMIGTDELRKYLYNNNFVIEDESLIYEDGKYYEIIFAKKGKSSYNMDNFCEIGHKLIEKKDPLLPDFLKHKISYNQNIINNLDISKGESLKSRAIELESKNDKFREALEIYERK